MVSLLLGCSAMGWLCVAVNEADLPRSVEELTKLHRAARDTIQSFSCEFEYVCENSRPVPSVTRQHGSYARRGETVRILYKDLNGDATDYLFHEGKVCVFTRGEKSLSGAIGGRDYPRSICELRSYLLLGFLLPCGNRYLGLEHFLTEAARVTDFRVDEKAGECTVFLQFPPQPPPYSDVRFELTFAARVDWLATKRVRIATSPLGVIKDATEITEFQVVAPGVSFPSKSVNVSTFSGDQHRACVTMSLSNLKVNQEIPPERFQFSFPEGLRIADNITRTTYQINAKGERISEAKPFSQVVAPPPIVAAVPGAVTESEGWAWGTWGMLISGIVLVTALAARGVRKLVRSAA